MKQYLIFIADVDVVSKWVIWIFAVFHAFLPNMKSILQRAERLGNLGTYLMYYFFRDSDAVKYI